MAFNKLWQPFIFSLTLFVSASLMFMLQPMVGKMMLPVVGGTPSGWLVAMAFFQTSLLGGYAAAHGLSRFSPRIQMLVSSALLVLATASLPIAFRMAGNDVDPVHVIKALFFSTFMPFFALATLSPGLQRLFAMGRDGVVEDPFFLFAASNLGSFAGLLAYPLVIERHFGLMAQAEMWRWTYALLVLLCLTCLVIAGRGNRVNKQSKVEESSLHQTISNRTRLRWAFLAFIPSSLMLGITSYITVEHGALPLFWVIPLALYLLTFVLAFARHQWIRLDWLAFLQPFCVALVAWMIVISPCGGDASPSSILLVVLAFVITAQYCHSVLSAEKPAPLYLTEFYLWISIGGALGGIFNAFIAPLLFPLPFEFSVVMVSSCLIAVESNFRTAMLKIKFPRAFWPIIVAVIVAGAALYAALVRLGFETNMLLALCGWLLSAILLLTLLILTVRPRMMLGVAVVACLLSFTVQTMPTLVDVKRSFFGVWRVLRVSTPDYAAKLLYHGSTVHGAQQFLPLVSTRPSTYYSERGPAGEVFSVYHPKDVGLIGLGSGTLMCYTAPDRRFTVYEIDPTVIDIAHRDFSFLSTCGDPVFVVGDGRQTMAASDNHYDLLIIDAFSSDMIPVHLLTREAFQLYLNHLTPNGLILIHVSSRYYDLRSPVQVVGREFGLLTAFRADNSPMPDHEHLKQFFASVPSVWIALGRDPALFETLRQKGWVDLAESAMPVWTDDFSDPIAVFHILGFK